MRARINGFEMNYEISGKETAPPIVLHHPLATDLTIWNELTAALEPKYRVIRMDARGHGKSEATPPPYDMFNLAKDVIGLMDHLGIKKSRYLGLSMGGFVGQVLGITHPERFHSLVLVSTSSDLTAAAPIWQARIETAAKEGMSQAIVDGSMQRWVAPEKLKSAPALVKRLGDMVAGTPVAGFTGWCQAIQKFNITSRLKEIDLPVRIVAGAIDPATTPAMMQIMHKEIKGSEYAEVPGTAHMLHVEEPAMFHAAVLPFIDAHGPKA